MRSSSSFVRSALNSLSLNQISYQKQRRRKNHSKSSSISMRTKWPLEPSKKTSSTTWTCAIFRALLIPVILVLFMPFKQIFKKMLNLKTQSWLGIVMVTGLRSIVDTWISCISLWMQKVSASWKNKRHSQMHTCKSSINKGNEHEDPPAHVVGYALCDSHIVLVKIHWLPNRLESEWKKGWK